MGPAARRLYQRPLARVYIKDRLLQAVLSAHVELGYDMAASTATVTLGTTTPPFWTEHDGIRIDMGYGGSGGAMMTAFAGEVETDNRKYSPKTLEIQAAGHAKRLQRPYGNAAIVTDPPTPAFTYASQTDTQIWNDVMRRAGVPHYDAGDGDSITYGTLKAYEVAVGTKLGDIINKLDEASKSGQRTFEIAGIVIRRPVLGVPSAQVAWHYAEGVQGLTAPYLPIIDVTRNVSLKDIQNQATVTGVGVSSTTDTTAAPVMASMQAVNDKLGKDGEGHDIYVPHSLSSDFLETRAQCVDVAKRYMTELNKETDDLTLRVALNPSIFPGQSIGVTSQKMEIGSERQYWVRHVAHDWGTGGGFTTLQLEGGAGAEGLLIGLPPVALFEMFVTSETFEVGGVLDTWHTVTADASTSYDPDGTIASYAWSATGGASGTGQVWQVRFTQAQWDDPDTSITLVVTDSDSGATGPRTNTLTQGVTGATGDDNTQTDGIYVAAGGQADASADAGLTWGTWSPGGGVQVQCVTRLSPGLAYFGLSDGKLVLTEDHLATAPTVKYTFPHAVTAVAVSEVDNNKVVVGLDQGDVWITLDAFATPPTLKRNYSWPIYWINGSIEQITQWRVATGSYVWITYDDFVTTGTLSTQANKIRQIELSNFTNYNVEDTDANVKVETIGTSLTYPAVSPAPAIAYLAHFLRTDELMVADDQSRAYVKAPGTLALTQVTSVGGGAVNALMASRTNPKVFYAGANDGLYKTYDAGQSWYRVRSYTADGLNALQLGLDSEPVTIRLVARVVEFISGGNTNQLGTHTGGMPIPLPLGAIHGTEWTIEMGVANGWPVGVSYDKHDDVPNPPEGTYPNFWLNAFDDSAWDDMEYNWGGYSRETLPRAWTVSPKKHTPYLDRDMYMLFRHHLAIATPAESTYGKAILTVVGWQQIVKLWFNGTQIHGAGSARGAFETQHDFPVLPYHGSHDGVYRIDVTDLVVPGSGNVLAGYYVSAHTGLAPGAISYRLLLNTSTQTVSAITEGPGTTFFTTVEESRGYDLLNQASIIAYPAGHAATVYLKAPPEGWTNQTYDDSGWGYPVAPTRWDIGSIPSAGNTTDPRISLLHGSQWMGTTWMYPNPGGVGLGSALRQHWAVPEGEYTIAKLSLRWIHTIKVWLNGTLVYQDDSDTAPGHPPAPGTRGKLGEALAIDVLSALKPGEDNVLCIQVQRPDSYPNYWWPTDFIGACAIMEVQ